MTTVQISTFNPSLFRILKWKESGDSWGFQRIPGDSWGFQGTPGDSRGFQGVPGDSRGFWGFLGILSGFSRFLQVYSKSVRGFWSVEPLVNNVIIAAWVSDWSCWASDRICKFRGVPGAFKSWGYHQQIPKPIPKPKICLIVPLKIRGTNKGWCFL